MGKVDIKHSRYRARQRVGACYRVQIPDVLVMAAIDAGIISVIEAFDRERIADVIAQLSEERLTEITKSATGNPTCRNYPV